MAINRITRGTRRAAVERAIVTKAACDLSRVGLAESNTRRLAVANRVMWWLDLLVGMVAMG